MMTLTHYTTGIAPFLFNSADVTLGEWWSIGGDNECGQSNRLGRRRLNLVEVAGLLLKSLLKFAIKNLKKKLIA